MLIKFMPPFAALTLLIACNSKPDAPKEVKLYSAEQLYNNKSIGGAAYNTDESRILVN